MHGFTGRILRVDLGTQKVRVVERDRDFYRQYLGGAYLAARLFQEELADPLEMVQQSARPARRYGGEHLEVF